MSNSAEQRLAGDRAAMGIRKTDQADPKQLVPDFNFPGGAPM